MNKGISKVETILKTVLTPHDPPEGLVENYILLIADKNIINFQKILDIKVILFLYKLVMFVIPL